MTITERPIATIRPYPQNARKIPQSAVDKVAKSITEFGWQQPIVIDPEGVIVVGHTRHLAAQQLGLATVPVHVATGLTPAQIRQYRLMDNRSHDEASWDFDVLGVEIADLRVLQLDLSLTGFGMTEIAKFAPIAGLVDPDEAPALADGPIVAQRGDVWRLGAHRVVCGDSTDQADVAKLYAFGVKPLLMVTDPPYGVDYDATWRVKSGVNKPWQTRAEDKVSNDDRAGWTAAWQLFTGDVAYVWHSITHGAEVENNLREAGFEIRSQIIWAKPALVMGRGHYHVQHEPCWYAVRKGRTGNWAGDRKQSTVWNIANMHRTQGNVDDGKTAHSTQKPVECMRRPIENNSKAGDAVYDPFLGSGTTLMAAEQTQRVCLGLEIEPAYVDMIVRRWQAFTGKEATLDGAGCTFNSRAMLATIGELDAHAEAAIITADVESSHAQTAV